MTPDDRQRARDRAADAIAPRELVICAGGWAPRPFDGTKTEYKRGLRARRRARGLRVT